MMRLGYFEEEKSILHLSRIKALFCSYADGNVAIVEYMLVVTSKEIGLEVNADNTEYMFKSRDQNAGRSHNIRLIII